MVLQLLVTILLFVKKSKWFEFNDTKVTSIDENKIFSQNAYCLFTKKFNYFFYFSIL